MTKLLEEAVERLRHLPEPIQDAAARAVIFQLQEESEPFEHFDKSSRDAHQSPLARRPKHIQWIARGQARLISKQEYI